MTWQLKELKANFWIVLNFAAQKFLSNTLQTLSSNMILDSVLLRYIISYYFDVLN